MQLPNDIPLSSEADQRNQITVDSQFIVDIVRDYWRITQACDRAQDAQSASIATIRSLLDHLGETLSLANIEISDPVGTPYSPGLKLEIFSVQPGGDAPTILETIQPGVSIDGYLYARPQVIVGK